MDNYGGNLSVTDWADMEVGPEDMLAKRERDECEVNELVVEFTALMSVDKNQLPF